MISITVENSAWLLDQICLLSDWLKFQISSSQKPKFYIFFCESEIQGGHCHLTLLNMENNNQKLFLRNCKLDWTQTVHE